MGRWARKVVAVLVVGAVLLAVAPAAPAAARSSGSEHFDGGLIVSGASGTRTVVGSVVAMSGVFKGVGRIVERPNRPGDSEKADRDDLVFASGVLHIVSVARKMSISVNRHTCTFTFTIKKTTSIDGGSRRFAGATGSFIGTVSGSAVARRTPKGACDQQHAALVEIDRVTGSGTLTY
jgi:hypothetical protein